MLAAVQHYVGLKFKDSPEYTRQPQVVFSEAVGKEKETELVPLTTATATTATDTDTTSSSSSSSATTDSTTTTTATATRTKKRRQQQQQPRSRAELEADNKVLRETLDKLHKQLLQAAPPPGPDGKEVPISEDMSQDFYQKLRQSLEPAVLKRTQSLAMQRQDSNESVEVKSTDVEVDADEEAASSGGSARAGGAPTGIGGVPLVDKRTEQVVLGARTREWATDPADDGDDDDNEQEEVCVVDLKDMEWWTVVPSEKDREMRALEHKVSEEDCPLDDPYVVLQDGDLVDALADFVAVAIARHPNVKQLTSSEMRGLIDQTFEQLQEQGTLMRMYSWVHFLYSTYGWGTCAYNLYKDPFYARLVLTGVWQAVTWALILVV